MRLRHSTTWISLSVGFALMAWLPAAARPSASAATENGPSPRSSVGMAYDAARRHVVLFGGSVANDFGSYDYLDDTWIWDGARWTEQPSIASPPARCCMGMAYDAARRQVVLFGGCDGSDEFDDTWVWDGSTWTEGYPSQSPSSRCSPGLAYDAARREVVMFGGLFGDLPEDFGTWMWNGRAWRRDAGPTPPWRHVMAMAYDGARRQVLLHGGAEPCFEWDCPLGDTWTWSGATWTERESSTSPPARWSQGTAFDAARAEVLIFGGESLEDVFGDTWSWNGRRWTREAPQHSPSPRASSRMAYDLARGEVVLFGGRLGFDEYLGDTWIWDGVDWSER